MTERFGRLPPLNSLRGFEAAARLGSFSRAAEELHMTQSAISHQIRALEDDLGQPLFKRIARTVELTDAGGDFFETTTSVLETLARGVRRLDSYTKPGTVIVSSTASLARRWLLPRLGDLCEAYPDVQPWIHTTEEIPDLEHDEIDLALHLTDEDPAGVSFDVLFGEFLTPLCTPALAVDFDPDAPRRFFEGNRLIHDEQREDWSSWLHAAGLVEVDVISGLNFSDSGMALDAALLGDGIVLGSLPLAHRELAEGKLVRISPIEIESASRYCLIYDERHLKRPAVRRMRDWIRAEAASLHTALGAAAMHPSSASGAP
ncbi:MAG: LysR substrate-binding domain-containing protein [Pseudomonadota bacterium]